MNKDLKDTFVGDPDAPLHIFFGQPAPILNTRPAVWDLVMQDMKARNEFGKAKYGTPLQAFNGRDALKDAYEEALDLCVYLRTAIEERMEGIGGA